MVHSIYKHDWQRSIYRDRSSLHNSLVKVARYDPCMPRPMYNGMKTSFIEIRQI